MHGCLRLVICYVNNEAWYMVEDLDSYAVCSGQRQPHPLAGGQFRSAFWNFILFRRMRSPENRTYCLVRESGCGTERRVREDGRFQTFQRLRRHGRLGACLQAEIAELPSYSKTTIGSSKPCMIDMHQVHDCLLCNSVLLSSRATLQRRRFIPLCGAWNSLCVHQCCSVCQISIH